MSTSISYQFRVSNFKSRAAEFTSSEFKLHGHKWKLIIFPKGTLQRHFVSVLLSCLDPPSEEVCFTIFVQKASSRASTIATKTNTAKFTDRLLGFHEFVANKTMSRCEDVIFGVDMSLVNECRLPFLLKLNDPNFSDVIFLVNDRKIYASKFLIRSYSKYFFSMFRQDAMIESEKGIVRLEDTDYNGVYAMLKYIYTGRLEKSYTVEECITIYNIGDMYMVEGLCSKAIEHILSNLSIHNIVAVLIFSYGSDLEEVWNTATIFVFRNWEALQKETSFDRLLEKPNRELYFDLIKGIMAYTPPIINPFSFL